MSENGEARFRKPKTVYEEHKLTDKKAFPFSTKYKNEWAVTIFAEWQISWSVILPFQIQERYLKAKINTRSHSFLPALKKWMQ